MSNYANYEQMSKVEFQNAKIEGLMKDLLENRDLVVRVGILGKNATAPHPVVKEKEQTYTVKKEFKTHTGMSIIETQQKTRTVKYKAEGKKTNAEIGAIHEFGKGNNPRRSFLEDSLKFKLNFHDRNGTALKKSLFAWYFLKNKPKKFLRDLGAECLRIIEEGFATNGFGMWEPWSKAYERRRISQVKNKKKREGFWFYHNILTATGKMRHSITFKVLKLK